nr:LysR family transcriptional regulator [Rhodococcus wratislaviensis]
MDLHRVDLNLLVALDALLAEESVTRAAERLQVGQSAMSGTLRRLRKLFKDPILIKHGRGLVATPYAKSLAVPLKDALYIIDSLLVSGSAFHPETSQREFTITANDYVAAVLLRPILSMLAAEAPHVTLHIEPARDDFAERLRRGDTDLLILPKAVFPRYSDFDHEPLFTDRYVCVVDTANPAVGDSLSLDQFSEQPYMSVNVGTLPSSAEMQLDALGVRRNTQVRIQTFTLAPFMLRNTRLLALIQERLARSLAHEQGLRLIEPPFPLQPLEMIMLWMRPNMTDPAHQWLRHKISALAEDVLPHPSP